jgi:hypothetical protein
MPTDRALNPPDATDQARILIDYLRGRGAMFSLESRCGRYVGVMRSPFRPDEEVLHQLGALDREIAYILMDEYADRLVDSLLRTMG